VSSLTFEENTCEALFITIAALFRLGFAMPVTADPLRCDVSGYKPVSGITATTTATDLTVLWDGDRGQQVRLRLAILDGTPTIQELAIRRATGAWAPLVVNVVPDFRVVSGLRRISNQQLRRCGTRRRTHAGNRGQVPLGAVLGRAARPERAVGAAAAIRRRQKACANSPGLPRKPEEITRASASYKAVGCTVKSDGLRLDASFPGVQLGVFSGTLRFSMFKGTT
jgi:hypothetical protein